LSTDGNGGESQQNMLAVFCLDEFVSIKQHDIVGEESSLDIVKERSHPCALAIREPWRVGYKHAA
jgi:hypothetical protein